MNPPGGNPPGGNPPGGWPPPGGNPPGGGPPPGGGAPGSWPAPGDAGAPQAGPPAPPAPIPPGGSGAPQVQFSELIENFKLLFMRSKSGILPAMVAIAALSIVVNSPSWVMNYFTLHALSNGDFQSFWAGGFGANCSRMFTLVAILLVGALRVGLARPMRRVMVDGPEAVNGVGDALKQSMEGYWMNLLAYFLVGIALAIGAILCILPMFVVAFFVAFVPYLVSSMNVEIVEAFKLSATYAKNQAPALIASMGIVILVMVVLGCCVGAGGNAIAVRLFGLMGTVAVTPLVSIIGELVGIVWWLFMGATFVTLETAETRTEIKR